MAPDNEHHPITEDELDQSLRGFYVLLERITQGLEWRNEQEWKQCGSDPANKPPHVPWEADFGS